MLWLTVQCLHGLMCLTLIPQLKILFGKVVEPLGPGDLLEEDIVGSGSIESVHFL